MSGFCSPPHLEHESINLDVNVLVRFLRVAELVDLHELLQTLPEVEGEQVDPHEAARIQNQLQGVQLDVQVRTRDYRKGRKWGKWKTLWQHYGASVIGYFINLQI